MGVFILSLVFCFSFFDSGEVAQGSDLQEKIDLKKIIKKVEENYQGTSSEAVILMKIKTAHWQRTLKLKVYSLGEDRFLARIISPAKEKGITTLKVGKNVWNYLPKVDRIIKISSSMMSGSWMGSHITNDDLVKEYQVEKLYDFKLLKDFKKNGKRFIRVLATPKKDAAVVWSKVIYLISMDDLNPVEVSYYDEEDKLVRIIKFGEVKEVDGKKVPMRMEVIPVLKKGESTVLIYEKLKFGVKIDKDFFSLENIKED